MRDVAMTDGVANLLFAVFGVLERVLALFLPRGVRLTFWGALAGVLAMALYHACSPQSRLDQLARQAAEANQQLGRYEGPFAGLWPLIGASLSLSAKRLGLTVGPVAISSLVVLPLMVWAALTFEHECPAAGVAVRVDTDPPGSVLVGRPAESLVRQRDGWTVNWPDRGRPVTLADGEGRIVASLPPSQAVTVLHKRRWWNLIVGNPIGYIPSSSQLDRITLDLPKVVYVPSVPGGLGTWEAVFFAPLLVVSILMRVALRTR